MEPTIHFEISGKPESVSALWVHEKPEHPGAVPYVLTVPLLQAKEIFGSKLETEVWSDFILRKVQNMGTLVIESYFRKAASIESERPHPKRWVIISLNKVIQLSETIQVHGFAEGFLK